MKLRNLNIENFQGLRTIALPLGQSPVWLLSGWNGAGKSSICDAVRLALTGQADRVSLKKEYADLVRQGAKSGSIAVTTDNGAITVALPSGTAKDTLPKLPHIRYVLDPTLFPRLPADERKALLFSVMGLTLTGQTMIPKLIERGCALDKVNQIEPLMGSGFAAAAKRAAEKASESRGAWKATTGETYGAVKAATWKAVAPLLTADEAADLTRIDAEIREVEEALADARKRHGAAEQAERHIAEYNEKLVETRKVARGFAEHDRLVQASEKILADVQAQIADARAKAGQAPARAPATLACPECAAVLVLEGGKLAPYVAPEPAPYDPEAAARIPRLQDGLRLQTAVVERHKANRAAADRAAAEVKVMEDNLPKAPEVSSDIIQVTIRELVAKLGDARERGRALNAKHEEAGAAESKTKKARQHHKDVEEWSKIAEALAPDGIPGEILSAALGPLNDRLRQHATDTGWMQVSIGPDMEIRANGRRYRSLSRSERWRADAMLGEALAYLTGLRVLILDEFDLVEPRDRGTVLNWLDDLAQAKELNSCILAGTLKTSPALPDHPNITPIRIEAGEIVVLRENPGVPVEQAAEAEATA